MKFDFKNEICAEHLAGMIRCKTESYPTLAQMDLNEFYRLHQYLEETYPLVHKHLQKEVVGPAALLYTWKGTGKSQNLPILLAAHQDVVPAGDWDKWAYPPFEGVVADGMIHGRGSGDCKNIIMAHMEAIEALLGVGFTPDYDIYLAYGFTEEVSGGEYNGAAEICKILQNRGITLGLVIDEGMGTRPGASEGVDCTICNVRVTEKGMANFEFTIRDKGGHALAPRKDSPIVKIGEVAKKINDNQFPYRLTSTVAAEYKYKAPYMGAAGEALLNLENNLESAIPYIEADPDLAAKFHTTIAMTMLSASKAVNVLPTEVKLVANCRLLAGDTKDDLQKHFEELLGPEVEVKYLNGFEPSAESSTTSLGYMCVKKVTEDLNPGVLVIPSIIPGGTDARQYYPICDSVYRMSGFKPTIGGNAHNFNEKMEYDFLYKGPEFIAELIQQYGDFTL